MRIFATTALTLIVASAASTALAGKDPVMTEFSFEPARVTQESVTLDEALRLTLENDPNVKIQEQSVIFQHGLLEQSQGQFDVILTAGLELSYTQTETDQSGIEAEKKKRKNLADSILEAGTEADSIEALLALIAAQDVDNFHLDSDDPIAQQINADIDLINALLAAASPEDRAEILALRDEYIADQIKALTTDRDALRKAELADIERLRKLGAIPTISEEFFGQLTLGASKQYRSGLTLGPSFKFTVEDAAAKGKPEDSSFGGKGIEGLYKAELGVSFSYSFGRGGSRQVVTAGEESAKKELSATKALFEQSSSTALYLTMLSYWSTVGAMEQLEVAEASLELQNRLIELTRDLVEGDELPATEMSRVEASASNSSARVRNAARQLYEARVRLAQQMGLHVTGVETAPLPSTGFPVPPDVEKIRAIDDQQVAEFAVMRRQDLAASKLFEEAGMILYYAAHHDLRGSLDVNGSVTYSGVAEDPSFRGGFRAAVGQWVGPSTRLGVNLSHPLGNNSAKGLLEQRSATLAQSAISRGDLQRSIKAGVVITLGALEDAIAQLNLTRNTVAYAEESLSTEVDKLRLGQSTIIDVVITEQRLTDSRLSLVLAQQQYAALLAQLRFETSTLIDGQGDDKRVSARDLMIPPFMD